VSRHKLRIVDGRPGRFWVDDAVIDAPLRFYSKLVYCTLARLVRGTEIKISRLDLTRLTDLGLSSVKRALAELENTGWIEIIQSGGLKVENTYRLLGRPALMVQPGPSMVQPEPSDGSARTATTKAEEATTEEARSKTEVQQSQRQHLAPGNGAARAAQTFQAGGLLPEVAVALEAPLEVPPTGSAARPAGPTPGCAAAPGATDPAAHAPARSGRLVVAAYCEAFKARYGANPIINGKDAGTLARLAKQIGDDYETCLARYFADSDPFLVKAAHSPALFETRLNALRVNGNGSRPASISEKWADAKPGLVAL
jgi:hypothetical protein